MISIRRQKEIQKHLRTLVPMAPLADFIEIEAAALAGHLRHLPPSIAAWQAVTTIARHTHTDYDTLLHEGYDNDAARHFVLNDINTILDQWGCTRKLEETDG
ncbi:MAG: DUF2293 domain-containing protein [Pseudomonadota bacterium]